MATIKRIATLGYANSTKLNAGNYSVDITENGDNYAAIPSKIALVANDGNDSLTVTSFRTFEGVFDLGRGDDYANLNLGNGTFVGGTIHGGDGNDTITAYSIEQLFGDDGDDMLYASGEVWGGAGNDYVRSETIAHGGDGNDKVDAYFEAAYGDDGNDTVTSNAEAYGGAGSDLVTATYDAYGDGGDDAVRSKRGDAYGGTGNDQVNADYGNSYGGDGHDTVFTQRGASYGEGGDDFVIGHLAAYGNAGDDIVVLTGEDGVVSGGDGNDELRGGSGNDLVIGGSDKDIMTGNGGADTFVFEKGDLGLSFASRDQITDFERGADKLDLCAFAGSIITFAHEVKYDLVKIDVNDDHRTDFLIQVWISGGGALTIGDIIVA